MPAVALVLTPSIAGTPKAPRPLATRATPPSTTPIVFSAFDKANSFGLDTPTGSRVSSAQGRRSCVHLFLLFFCSADARPHRQAFNPPALKRRFRVPSLLPTSRPALPSTSWATPNCGPAATIIRSEEHTSELQSLMRTSYAVFRL